MRWADDRRKTSAAHLSGDLSRRVWQSMSVNKGSKIRHCSRVNGVARNLAQQHAFNTLGAHVIYTALRARIPLFSASKRPPPIAQYENTIHDTAAGPPVSAAHTSFRELVF